MNILGYALSMVKRLATINSNMGDSVSKLKEFLRVTQIHGDQSLVDFAHPGIKNSNNNKAANFRYDADGGWTAGGETTWMGLPRKTPSWFASLIPMMTPGNRIMRP